LQIEKRLERLKKGRVKDPQVKAMVLHMYPNQIVANSFPLSLEFKNSETRIFD
jgi:hypothetical protein